jgi:hypothetical protein
MGGENQVMLLSCFQLENKQDKHLNSIDKELEVDILSLLLFQVISSKDSDDDAK